MRSINLLILLLTISSFCFSQNSEEKAIKTAFSDYKSAILNDKGKEAVSHVDSRTIKYYDDILDQVKHADADKVKKLSILDQLMIFSVRHRASREEILSFDGKSLLEYAIATGMVGKNSVSSASIGDVTINGESANGVFVANGMETPLKFDFYKEEGQWKIDLTSIFPFTTTMLQQMANQAGGESHDFIFSLLETVTGKKPGKEIWNTIK